MVTAGILRFRENSHGRTGNRTRDLMISSQRLWPLDHEAGRYLPKEKLVPVKWLIVYFIIGPLFGKCMQTHWMPESCKHTNCLDTQSARGTVCFRDVTSSLTGNELTKGLSPLLCSHGKRVTTPCERIQPRQPWRCISPGLYLFPSLDDLICSPSDGSGSEGRLHFYKPCIQQTQQI